MSDFGQKRVNGNGPPSEGDHVPICIGANQQAAVTAHSSDITLRLRVGHFVDYVKAIGRGWDSK